jgi:Carboxypeptidase regulatory-like domain
MARHTVLKASAISGLLQIAKCFAEKTLTELPRQAAAVALLVCTLALFAPSLDVFAQIATGRIVGRVTDASGAAIAGATVTIKNDATGINQTVRSSAAGDYVFEAVNPGTYTLSVNNPGFGEFTRSGIQAHIQDNLTIDVSLTVGSVSQQISVTGATPLLQQQDASVGQTIDEAQVNNMPLQSRDWTTLSLLAAGTSTTGGASNAEFNVMGQNWTQNDFRLNGIDDNVEIYGGGNIQGAGGNNGYTAFVPPPDAIQEFKLQTGNFDAEFGHSTGGIINAVIKSGTNSLHGDLWEYVRNTVFNANDYFANQTDTPRPAYHQNQFGGTVGGPVYIPKLYDGRNRTFFFFDYQGTRINTPTASTSSVPTASMHSSNFTNFQDYFSLVSGTKTDALGRIYPLATILDPATTRMVAANTVDPVSGLPNASGSAIYVRDPFYTNGSISGIRDFSSQSQYLNILPPSRLDPNAVKLLALYPNPTPGRTTFPNYYQFAAGTNNINQFDVRIDENISSKDILFGVYSYSNETIFSPPALPGYAEGQVYGDGPEQGPRYGIVVGYTHVFTPSLTNEFHIGFIHNIERLNAVYGDTFGIPEQFGIPGVPQIPGNGGLPIINIASLTGMGAAGWMPTLSTIRTLEIMDNVTKIYGSHTFKSGFQVDNFYAPLIQPPFGRGTFSFTGQYSDIPNQNSGYEGVGDMLLVPTASTVPGGINNVGGLETYGLSNYAQVSDQRYYIGAYFQDDWKVTPKMTLNLGLRWDHYTPYQEINGRQANFIQTGGGSGSSGTYYMPKRGCAVPTSSTFQALLASYDIGLSCTSNTATGDAQNLNFAPRIGFAYRVTPRAVVRGGYGITFGALNNIGFGYNIGNNYPFSYSVNYYAVNSQTPLTVPGGATAVLGNALVAQNLEDPVAVNGAGLTLLGRQCNFKTPYQQTFNLTAQDQFTQHDSFSVGYVATLGRHLDSASTQNAPSAIMPPGTNMYDPTVEGHIAFPAFAPNGVFETTTSSSNYNSLQVIYEHQFFAGLTALANYTYSKCLTDQRSIEGAVASQPAYRAPWLPGFGQAADYGLCFADTAQVFHASGTYYLPFGRKQPFLNNINTVTDTFIGGWMTNFIYSHQTGQPFTIGCPIATTADFGCFANVVPGQNVYGGPHNVHQWLNPNAFANPPLATEIGQLNTTPLGGGPTPVRGPGFQNLDMSLFKQFPIHESVKLEFRAEAFNLPNWHSFANPPSYNLNFLNTASFGEITSSRSNPRILQLALKLYY